MPKSKTKPRPKAKKRKVIVKTPVFPSQFKIGQKVSLNFHVSGAIAGHCLISGVTFTKSKVYYDVDVMVYPPSKDITANVISHNKERFITLKEVDSICVESI